MFPRHYCRGAVRVRVGVWDGATVGARADLRLQGGRKGGKVELFPTSPAWPGLGLRFWG